MEAAMEAAAARTAQAVAAEEVGEATEVEVPQAVAMAGAKAVEMVVVAMVAGEKVDT